MRLIHPPIIPVAVCSPGRKWYYRYSSSFAVASTLAVHLHSSFVEISLLSNRMLISNANSMEEDESQTLLYICSIFL